MTWISFDSLCYKQLRLLVNTFDNKMAVFNLHKPNRKILY